MIQKTGYDPSTGEITQVIEGDEGVLIVPEDTDEEAWVDGYGDFESQKVVNGQIVDKPSSDLEEQKIEKAWEELYAQRKLLLYGSDWTQVPDAPVDAAEWAVYRQELRDLPSNTSDPRYPFWPIPPS